MSTNGEYPTTQAFPTPSATPVRETSSHRRDSSSGPSSSPVSRPDQTPGGHNDHEDVVDDNNLMPFDPRRFTPTLHASLVSEILSLRRDAESKAKTIDGLEHSLEESRTENENLDANLAKRTKEGRSLKHQLQLLEGGSSSALTELAMERDEALENISDVRRRLEQAQKKVRSREEDVERTQLLWDRDRGSWENERRSMERKIHVVEGRLKAILDEVAAAQAAETSNTGPKDEGTTKESDSASIRSAGQGQRRASVTSMSSDEGDVHNQRYSVMSTANGHAIKNDSQNLADELAFDEEEEFESLDGDATPDSPEALPEERPKSVNSQVSDTMGMGMKARKVLGLYLNDEGGNVAGRASALEGPVVSSLETRVYRDTGIQYSPPPSPKSLSEPGDLELMDAKKLPQVKDSSTLTVSADMVSASCQTVGDLLSPPTTPKPIDATPQPAAVPAKVAMTSASTQTVRVASTDEKTSALSPNSAPKLDVPMISIHPPCSEPPSPRTSVVLPPQTKSAACQVNFRSVVDGRSIAIQTEEIRIDQRPVKLPASLLPSAIPDLPLGNASQDRAISYTVPPPRFSNGVGKSRHRVIESPPGSSKGKLPQQTQAYPGNNDNGPLSEDPKSVIRRPLRSSSLFAGFEELSDEEPESPGTKKDIFTDDSLLNRPLASYTLQRGKLVPALNQSGLDEITLPEIGEHLAECDSKVYEKSNGDAGKDYGPSKGGQRPGAVASGPRQQDVRKAAMISSGAAVHQKARSRSPSEPSMDSSGSGIAPPFPVPIRLSSRKFPITGSEGRQSPTPSGVRNITDRPRQPIVRRPTLRRVRSATTVSHTDRHVRSGSGSSQAISNSSYTPESPGLPPLPFDDITAPGEKRWAKNPHVRGPSRTFGHERHDSAATIVQQTSVVDAIAQTMVGEWMLKYIRRRKSFGGNDPKDGWDGRNVEEMSASITNSGVRHKRWVWLAPYERAIMWSSKQPTSGPALLGKSGRKCKYMLWWCSTLITDSGCSHYPVCSRCQG